MADLLPDQAQAAVALSNRAEGGGDDGRRLVLHDDGRAVDALAGGHGAAVHLGRVHGCAQGGVVEPPRAGRFRGRAAVVARGLGHRRHLGRDGELPVRDLDHQPFDDASEKRAIGRLEGRDDHWDVALREGPVRQGDRDFPALPDIAHLCDQARFARGLSRAAIDEGVRRLRQVRQRRVHGAGIEPVEPLVEPARRLEAHRRLQEADGRADARAGRDQRLVEPQLLAEAAGMERRAAAEGDHGELRDVATVLDCMDAGGIGHVLVHHLGDPEGRLVEHQAEGLQRRLCPVGVERDGPAREIVRVEPAEREVGVRHRWRLTTPPVTGGPGFRPRRMRTDAQPSHPVDPGD
jgi:hypothetical protein